MTRPVRPAIVGMMDRLMDERRGELRRLDLLAHGIDLDLDQAGLIALSQAPDHDDILDKLKIPERLLAPLWEDWRQSRVLFTVGVPSAVACWGEVTGQAVIARARAEADRVRALLVELARLVITGQVEELAAPLPPYEPGSLDWHEAIDQLVDQLQDPAQLQDQHQTPRQDGARDALSIRSEAMRSGTSDSTSTGEGRPYSREQDRSNVRNEKIVHDRDNDDWRPM
jgi:hypothetical protein